MQQTDDVIRLLPDSVANQIAAGEVIQRPASVIKELVENSVDAGSTSIEIVVKDAGKTLIQVIDDGKGMSTTDARMAFERHATSKIRCAEDLFSLTTMGFRGEALPSIAAVSEIELTTRRPDDELGTKLVIRASHVDNQEPAVAAKGTNIKVRNLFYNFVARRRFLKKDNIELSHIVHEFERLALVNTDVAFKFSSNGTLLHSLPKGPLKDRITALFGKSVGETLIPVSTETSMVKIEGFISLPSGARQRAQRQFMFVNGRNMRHPYFHKAILSCYENLIPKDYQPHYFISFHVNPDRIDVNIHPQKHEIKFEDEQSIWHILTASIRESLGRFNVASTIEFENFGAPDIPALNSQNLDEQQIQSLNGVEAADYNPFLIFRNDERPSTANRLDFNEDATMSSMASRPSALNNTGINRRNENRQFTQGWEAFYKSIENKPDKETDLAVSFPLNKEQTDGFDFPTLPGENATPLFQVREKYIVLEVADSLLFIDQHRAHFSIIFNTLKNTVQSGQVSSQQLMFAEPLDLEPEERVMFDSSIELIERIGFRFGDNNGTLTLEGIPETLGHKNPVVALKTILNDLAESGIDVEADALNRVLLTMAKSAAMTAGQKLTHTEMDHLVSALFHLPSPKYTPDGHTVIFRLTDDRLSSFFN